MLEKEPIAFLDAIYVVCDWKLYPPDRILCLYSVIATIRSCSPIPPWRLIQLFELRSSACSRLTTCKGTSRSLSRTDTEVQKATDAKLVDLQRRSLPLPQEIRELKMQRNTHALMSQLPDEILLEIFMVMMTCFPIENWHRVAHVCRRWRNVAVGAPMLWTNPPTYRHNFTMLMLERSKRAGLTIRLDSDTRYETAHAVLDCIGRIESLEIVQNDDDDDSDKDFFFQQVLVPALKQEASRLKSLKITCYAEEIWDCGAMLRLLYPLNQLQKLLLSRVLFDWDILPLHNLTHLNFEDVSLHAPISIQQFINTLRQMPRLESLALPFSGDILSSHTLPPTAEANLTLPFLRFLDLTSSHPDHLVYFLAHTAFPRLHRLEIGIVDPRGYTDFQQSYYSTIIQAIAFAVTNGDFGTFESLSFNSSSFRMTLFGRDDNSPSLYLHIPMPQAWNAGSDIGTQMLLDMFDLCRPNLSKLVHLSLYGVLTEAEYMRLFEKLCRSHLQKITIRNSKTMPTLTSVLAVPSYHHSESPMIPFLNMKSISCDNVRFSNSSVLDAFTDCLMSRRACGYPLHELVLLYCSNVTSKQRARLKQAVVNLNYAPARF